MTQQVSTIEDVIRLFPTTAEHIAQYSSLHQDAFKKEINTLVQLPPQEYRFDRVALVYDRAENNLLQALSIIYTLQETHPDDHMRMVAQQEVTAIENCLIDNGYHNRALYEMLRYYHEVVEPQESLDDEQKYYVAKVLHDFERSGINLPEESRKAVEDLHKELARLSLEFERTIATDGTKVIVARDELVGLNDDFISSLEKDEEGRIILSLDYPTYFTVLGHCENKMVREKMWRAFECRAYPHNLTVLEEVIKKREQLSSLLACPSFAHLEIEDAMAETPEKVQVFLNDLVKRSQEKALQEFSAMTRALPPSVELSPEGTLYPWDIRFLQESYKKKHFHLDEMELAEYFPLEHTLEQLLAIYSAFLGIKFEEVVVPAHAFWHEDVRVLKASIPENNETLGFILLDLFPRPNKFSHAAQLDIVSALRNEDGTRTVAVAIVLTNFPKPTQETPSLLKHDDVITFFHEFGHALHALLGVTKMALFTGTHVKTDFVELPSQMLEEWMWQPSMLKKVSKHYQTGEPLSDELIANMVSVKHLESGFWTLRQSVLSQFSLDLHLCKGMHTSLLYKNICHKLQPLIHFHEDGHLYCSFGHLMRYGSRYYSYLWSKVFALDVFSYIKEHGLNNQEIGKHYVQEILSKGGSIHPIILLKNFLGRGPNSDAFFKDLGFDD